MSNETIADIVAEKRREAQDILRINDTPWGRREALELTDEADRIEAAFNRLVVPTPEQWTEIARQEAEIADLKRENARLIGEAQRDIEAVSDKYGRHIKALMLENTRLRAALKPVLECKVMSAMTAEIEPGVSEYCSNIIFNAQRIYNESGESEVKE